MVASFIGILLALKRDLLSVYIIVVFSFIKFVSCVSRLLSMVGIKRPGALELIEMLSSDLSSTTWFCLELLAACLILPSCWEMPALDMELLSVPLARKAFGAVPALSINLRLSRTF